MSSSIIGPTSGPICCWFRAASFNSTAMWSFYDWIRDSVKAEQALEQVRLRDFHSSGSTRENGALNYFVLHKDPIDLTENAHRGVPRPTHHLRALPQSSARKVDAEAVLRDGESVRARRREERRGAGRQRGVRQGLRRRHPSASCCGRCRPRRSTAQPCRSIPPRTADRVCELADQPENNAISRARWSIASGPTSWAAAWSIRWTICARPIPLRTKNCSPR